MTPKSKIACIKKTQTNLLTYFYYFLNCILKHEDHIKHLVWFLIIISWIPIFRDFFVEFINKIRFSLKYDF